MADEMSRQFFLVVDPTVDKIAFPNFFYVGFDHELGEKAELTDPSGAWISIRVEKKTNKAYLSDGLKNILYHYNMSSGCWLRMLYIDNSKFYMNVMNMRLKQISYPIGMTIDYETFVIPEMENIHDDDDLLNVECRTRCEITLTAKQAKGSSINLPTNFVREGLLETMPHTVFIVNKKGKKLKCNLRFGSRRNGEAHLGGKWRKFCLKHNLKCGSRVVLGVDATDVTKIHARIKQ